MLCGTLPSTPTWAASPVAQPHIQPFPRQPLPAETVFRWNLREVVAKTPTANECTLAATDEGLQITSTGSDPYFLLPEVAAELPKPLLVRLRAKFQTGGPGRVYWRTHQSPNWSEQQAQGFSPAHDGQWHDYEIPLDLHDSLRQLRLDPGMAAGKAVLGSIELAQLRLHPLEIEAIETSADRIYLDVRNHDLAPITFRWTDRDWTLNANSAQRLELKVAGQAPFEIRPIEITSTDLPPLRRQAVIIRPDAKTDWSVLRSARLRVEVAPDGSGARLWRQDQLVGYVAPLVHREGIVPDLKVTSASDDQLELRGPDCAVKLKLSGDELDVRIDGSQPCEGPVVRSVGMLEQGLLAGLEYLGKDEQSSSKLDIETPEHLRFAPRPLQITMPLAICRTAGATISLVWDDMRLQPWYAVPNFLDGAPGQRMSLRGDTIGATLRIADESLESAIVWAVRRHRLPPLPPAVRTPSEQQALCLKALKGPLRGPGGWGHCAEPNWGRAPYADMASSMFYLTGRMPELKDLVADGSHLRNDAAFFLNGRAANWRDVRAGEAQAIVAAQRPDGSFHYDGPFARTHFESTASGLVAERAARLLDWVALSGDPAAREAGLRSLDYLRRFRTPRGAQTWEVPLHTPDILASAWLVRAYLRGHELTARDDYLREATKWAITGVPFVYQWSTRPVMMYAAISVLGATNWQAPNWIGLPVQWCGIVYADAIAQLAPHDHTLDWKQLAEGILRSAEQMQYAAGPFVSCLPDSFDPANQQRNPTAINPCALVYLRRQLDGDTVGLCVATSKEHRIVAPFPTAIERDKATIKAISGVRYEVMVDGQRVVPIISQGIDVIDLSK